MFLRHLLCSLCGRATGCERLAGVCGSCESPLFAVYDLPAAGRTLRREELLDRPASLWRYAELLPVEPDAAASLGETMTPLLPLQRLGEEWGLASVWLKDESRLPTGTFKARGMAVAVSRARRLGASVIALPSAGNAGVAAAAYGARAGLEVVVALPENASPVHREECVAAGARVVLVRGGFDDAARLVDEGAERHGWFNLGALREPYRLEGKKTLGYEMVEQLGWQVPDVVVFPTGAGTGILGVWKALAELEALGWLEPPSPAGRRGREPGRRRRSPGRLRPRMVAVQAAGCAPLVRACERGETETVPWSGTHTVAAGLRVPQPPGGPWVLSLLRDSRGTAVAVHDEDMRQAALAAGRLEGIVPCPEGAAALAAVKALTAAGWIRPHETVVACNTASPSKYTGWLT